MATTNQLRSWWASYLCDSHEYERVDFPGDGRTWSLYVARPSVALWRAFASVMREHNYLFRETAGGTYNCRKIASSGNWSTHAYAIAIDLNPSKNPYNTFTTDQPRAFRDDVLAIRTTKGTRAFTWGGDWDNDNRQDDKGPDPMHWQLNVPPSDTEPATMEDDMPTADEVRAIVREELDRPIEGAAQPPGKFWGIQQANALTPIGNTGLNAAQHWSKTLTLVQQIFGVVKGIPTDPVDEQELAEAVADLIEAEGISDAVADELARRLES